MGAFDVMLAFSMMWFAFWLRFEGNHPPEYVPRVLVFSLISPVILVAFGYRMSVYRSLRRYTSMRELVQLTSVVMATFVALVVINELVHFTQGRRAVPASVPLIWLPGLMLSLVSFRILPRIRDHLTAFNTVSVDAERVIVAGAGDAGEHLVRDLLRNPSDNLVPVGFLDDDRAKRSKKIHGLPVLGPISQAADIVSKMAVDHIIVAIPSATSATMQEILNSMRESNASVKVLPRLGELMGNRPTAADIRDVDIADLIGRTPVDVDHEQIASVFRGRVVLITGAAGSIGSVLARQSLRFGPAKLLLLDSNETDLYLHMETLKPLARSRECGLEMLIADVRDRKRIDEIFCLYRPNLVLHAAAYKHVSVMEEHPCEAVKTNVMGTRNVASAANRYQAERMILVSTDKAVQPISVMGATKRAAELALSMVAAYSETAFASVRFGNVLGSRGSVVPIFAEQIRKGGPITVTDPDATRYFMTIEEATALICQAGALAKGGETFVLQMGEPVRILDLAKRMRAMMAGADHIQIVVSGLRGGEKLHEDLWQPGEVQLGEVQPGILKVRPAGDALDPLDIDRFMTELEEIAEAGIEGEEKLKETLFSFVADGPSKASPAREQV